MARKRMIDPGIWESAYDKSWTTAEFTVMVAAISAADDDGRGRVSMIYRNCGNMISEKKFKKCLQNLDDSIKVYQKIYFFLPHWKDYQTINRPTKSRIPKPNFAESKELPNNTHGITHGATHEKFVSDSRLSEVKLKEVSLKEVKEITSSIKQLFQKHTRISEPNIQLHIEPVLKFYKAIPEHLTVSDIDTCVSEAFSKLSKDKGVKMEFLIENIQRNITIKHESVLELRKKPQEKQAAKDRDVEKQNELKEKSQLAAKYRKFYENNEQLFSDFEKSELLKYLSKGNVMQAGAIIEPKMENIELT